MSTLILTSRSASDSPRLLALADDIAKEGQQVGFVFVGDGVYSTVTGSESYAALRKAGSSFRLFACKQDVEARGIIGKVAPEAKVVDYNQMVEIMMQEYSKVVSYL
jgi:sulfur relay protein TusB/DsrH